MTIKSFKSLQSIRHFSLFPQKQAAQYFSLEKDRLHVLSGKNKNARELRWLVKMFECV